VELEVRQLHTIIRIQPLERIYGKTVSDALESDSLSRTSCVDECWVGYQDVESGDRAVTEVKCCSLILIRDFLTDEHLGRRFAWNGLPAQDCGFGEIADVHSKVVAFHGFLHHVVDRVRSHSSKSVLEDFGEVRSHLAIKRTAEKAENDLLVVATPYDSEEAGRVSDLCIGKITHCVVDVWISALWRSRTDGADDR
jgi:hypothetical protein